MARRLEGVRIHRARPDDIQACGRVFSRAERAMGRRLGLSVHTGPSTIAPILSHVRETDPGSFQVAEVGGRAVGYASVISRGRTDFITQLWVNPSLIGRGVGRPLLERAVAGVTPARGDVLCVVSSIDSRALHLYLSLGLLPGTMVYEFGGKPHRLANEPRRRVHLQPVTEASVANREALDLAARFDRELRGARRDADIRFIVTRRRATVFRALAGRREVGYVVLASTGRVGPGGTQSPARAAGLMWSALREVGRVGAKEVATIVPGSNPGAVGVAIAAGLRGEFPGIWMSQRNVLANDRYLAGSGILW